MQPRFIHLRVHSEFSLIDGLVKIKPLIKQLTAFAMPAIALTDHVNLFGLVKLYKASIAQGIKPIAGADVLVANADAPDLPYRLTFLALNHTGYVTLTELVSQAYQQGQNKDGIPLLQREWIEMNNTGLLALSGAMQGDIGRALLSENHDMAKTWANYWKNLLPNRFYLELQRVGKADEERYIALATQLAAALSLPVVATNDVRFLQESDFAAHEVRVCIHQGRVLDDPRRPKDYTHQQYLRSEEEMVALFADFPEALANTVEIAKRCNLALSLGKNFLPQFPTPNGESLDDYLVIKAKEGLAQRLEVLYPNPEVRAQKAPEYEARLDFETGIIIQMGFPGYFLIVADFINWAKHNGVPVGPGRGSGAGSVVAYSLGITDLDPLQYALLFERFLNPERVSMPDFDIDFCQEGRDRVIDYV
ncbi:MAG TPA: DNA polymerase III subunit alpha, partial [Methylococcaceae bacterium]|nr:DNA polymerase III subunit alpha [Methylococcaceae bacterium]